MSCIPSRESRCPLNTTSTVASRPDALHYSSHSTPHRTPLGASLAVRVHTMSRTAAAFDYADAFASTSHRARGIATASAFKAALEWITSQPSSMLAHLRRTGVVNERDGDTLDPHATPYDHVLRLACGVAPNFVEQRAALGTLADAFVVAHHDVAYDRAWDDVTARNGALAGPDRAMGGLPGHVVITTKDVHWSKANVATLALAEDGAEPTEESKAQAVTFLQCMRECAMRYARHRGWTQCGLYFRFFGCAPSGEEERGIIRLHVVNLARAGPRLRRTAKVNLPIDDVIEALGGRRTTRRGSVIVVEPIGAGMDVPVEMTAQTTSSSARRFLERRRQRRERLENSRASSSENDDDDDDDERVENVVVSRRQSAVPVKEPEVSIPDAVRREFHNVARTERVMNALRVAQKENDETRATTCESDQMEDYGAVRSFIDDVEWLSTYKSLATSAQVSRALQDIHQQIRR